MYLQWSNSDIIRSITDLQKKTHFKCVFQTGRFWPSSSDNFGEVSALFAHACCTLIYTKLIVLTNSRQLCLAVLFIPPASEKMATAMASKRQQQQQQLPQAGFFIAHIYAGRQRLHSTLRPIYTNINIYTGLACMRATYVGHRQAIQGPSNLTILLDLVVVDWAIALYWLKTWCTSGYSFSLRPNSC